MKAQMLFGVMVDIIIAAAFATAAASAAHGMFTITASEINALSGSIAAANTSLGRSTWAGAGFSVVVR